MDEEKTLTPDDVIAMIAEILPENDGEFIEDIANRVLGNKVRYLEEEDLFEFI
jgi:hypothetical protein